MTPLSQTINRKQLAELAGVSPAVITTVMKNSRSTVAVSEGTRARVLELAQKHNYRPDISGTSLVSGHSFLVAVIFTEEMGHVMWETIRGLEGAAAEKDYAVVVFPVPSCLEEEAVRLRRALSRKVAAIACIPVLDKTSRSNLSIYRSIEASGVPIVQLFSDNIKKLPTVGIDEASAAQMATDYLIAKGHRRILHFTRTDSRDLLFPGRFISEKHRRKGYTAAMKLAGLKPIIMEVDGDGDKLVKNCQAAAHDVIRHPDAPTAALCYSDSRAISLMNGLRNLGVSVPEEFSVVGFDNNIMCTLSSPTLTSVQVNRAEIGRKAWELIAQRIAGTPVKDVYVPVDIFERESVSPPRCPA